MVGGQVVVGDGCATVHKFMNREILIFDEPEFLNTGFDPVGKLLFAFHKCPQLARVDGLDADAGNLAGFDFDQIRHGKPPTQN